MKKNISNREDPVQDADPSVNFNISFVKSGETLESISWDLGIENPKYLREYHNARCSSLDSIPEDGTLRFLQKICIPKPNEVAKINRQIRQRRESLCYLLPEGKIPFDITLISGDYAVIQTESDDGIQKLEYAYRVHFNYIKEAEDRHYINFSMSDFKKNGEEPDEKINSLASDFIKIIYPITFTTDHIGNLLSVEFQNDIKEIINRLEALKKYHVGIYAASHIDQMKERLVNPQTVYGSIKKMLAVQFLFNRFYQADYHSKDTTVPYNDELSWLAPASPIRFEMIHQTLPQHDPKFIELLQTGKSTDYRSIQELYYTDQEYGEYNSPHLKSVKGDHQAMYTLDFKDFSVQKIRAELLLQMPDYEKKMTFELEKLVGSFSNYY